MLRLARHSVMGFCALGVLACSADKMPTDPESPRALSLGPATPSTIISDAAHTGGTAGFYFLPPMVSDPNATGTFDASFLPYTTVRVCELGASGCVLPVLVEYSSLSGAGSEVLRIPDGEEHYIVNWHTDQFDLDADKTYRIEVQVADVVIGFADVDVVTNGRDLKNVVTGEFIALKDGRTLPIKLRLEDDLPGIEVVGAEGGTVSAEGGLVRLYVPRDALASETVITITPTGEAPIEEGTIPGTLWTFSPDGLSFDQPVQLTLTYDPNDLPAGLTDPATSLTLGTSIEGLWQELVSTVDDARYEVTASINGFSIYGMLLRIHRIDITPAPAALEVGESAALVAHLVSATGAPLIARWLVWGSSDASVVGLDADSDGMIHTALATGLAAGEATVGVVGVVEGCPASPFILCVGLPTGRDPVVGFAAVTVGNEPPIANFSYSCPTLSCTFTDLSTDDGMVISWSWDFGDGGTSTGRNPSHTFSAAGQYTVTLTVVDDHGATRSNTQLVTTTTAVGFTGTWHIAGGGFWFQSPVLVTEGNISITLSQVGASVGSQIQGTFVLIDQSCPLAGQVTFHGIIDTHEVWAAPVQLQCEQLKSIGGFNLTISSLDPDRLTGSFSGGSFQMFRVVQ